MAERQAALNKIADHCVAPRNSWKLVAADTVLLYFPEDLSHEKRICLIYGLRDARLPVKFAPGNNTITVEEK